MTIVSWRHPKNKRFAQVDPIWALLTSPPHYGSCAGSHEGFPRNRVRSVRARLGGGRARGGRRGVRRPRRPRCRRWGWPGRARARRRGRPASAASGSPRTAPARSTPCGVPKSRSNDAACSGAPCSSEREDPAAVVVDHHDRQVGPRLVGAEDQPVASCRNVTSPISARARVVRGRPRAAPIAVDTVPSMPAGRGWRHHAPVADPVARHHQVEVADRVGGADDEQPAARAARG